MGGHLRLKKRYKNVCPPSHAIEVEKVLMDYFVNNYFWLRIEKKEEGSQKSFIPIWYQMKRIYTHRLKGESVENSLRVTYFHSLSHPLVLSTSIIKHKKFYNIKKKKKKKAMMMGRRFNVWIREKTYFFLEQFECG